MGRVGPIAPVPEHPLLPNMLTRLLASRLLSILLEQPRVQSCLPHNEQINYHPNPTASWLKDAKARIILPLASVKRTTKRQASPSRWHGDDVTLAIFFARRWAPEPTKHGFDLHEPVARPTQLRHRSRMDKYWATC